MRGGLAPVVDHRAYVPPLALLLVHVDVATNWLGFVPSLPARMALDQFELGYLGVYFLLAAAIFLHSYRRTRSGILRQQLKWVTGGTLAGIVPFAILYIVPYALGTFPRPWMNLSALSLALVPLCFAYAIIRYRLMDVDIIFKRGLAYTAATAGVLAVYVAMVGPIGALFHTAWPSGLAGEVMAIVVAAFLFQPFRDWTQARLDRFFYRDRLDYRRTLIEFGRTLTNEVRLEPMLASVMDRLSQTLLVDRLAVFLENAPGFGEYRLARSMGLRSGDLLHPVSGLEGRLEGALEGRFSGMARALALPMGQMAPEALAGKFRGARFEFSVARTSGICSRLLILRIAASVARGQRFGAAHARTLDLNYFIPCRIRDRTIAVLGLGKTVDGDFLTTEDVELLFTIAGYVAIALDNAQLYSSLEQKAQQIERLKDFSENIVESLNVGVLAVDLEGRVEFWNTQMEGLTGIAARRSGGPALEEVLPATWRRKSPRARTKSASPVCTNSICAIAKGAICW